MGRFRQRADESCWGIRGWKMKINWFNSSFTNKWNSYTNFKRIWTASEDTDREMHCEASLQRTSPTAIGGEPIEFFFNVGREAPHKWETINNRWNNPWTQYIHELRQRFLKQRTDPGGRARGDLLQVTGPQPWESRGSASRKGLQCFNHIVLKNLNLAGDKGRDGSGCGRLWMFWYYVRQHIIT